MVPEALEQAAASGRKPFPQVVVAFDRFACRSLFQLVEVDCRCEGPPETAIIYSRKVLTQGRVGKYIRLQNCLAKFYAGPSKKAERRSGAPGLTKRIDLRRDRHGRLLVGIL